MYMDFWIVLGLATFAGCWPGTASLALKSSSIPIDGRLHSFTLHELETSPDPVSGNWTNALETCQREGSQLAVVRSQQEKNVMEELQKYVNSSSETHHAWVSGRRSPDTAWRDLHGQPVTADIHDHTYITDPALCGLAEYGGNSTTIYKNRCTTLSSNTNYRPLCQAPRSSNGSCPMGFRNVGAVGCYALLGEITSWLTARQQCQELAPIDDLGDLAYSDLNQTDIREFVLLHGRDPGSNATNPVSVWVGVMSQPWMWWTTANPPSAANRSSLVTYQGWVHREGASDNNETCMALDLGQDARWIDVACNTQARYYVCQRDEGMTVSPIYSRPTVGPLLTDETATISMMSGGPAEGQLLTESHVIAIAVAGGVLFLLLVLTPLAVYCHRRKSKEQNQLAQSISPAADVTSHAAYVQDEEVGPHREPGSSAAGRGGEPASDDSHLYHQDGARHGGDPETATREGHHYSVLQRHPDQDARDSHEYAEITPDLTPEYDDTEVDGERP